MTQLSNDAARRIIGSLSKPKLPRYGTPEHKAMCEGHAHAPQAGDYWHDQFSPVCVVLVVEAGIVTLCRKVREVDREHWDWDLDQVERKGVAEFERWLRYDSIPGYWGDVVPRRMKAHADAFAASRRLS